ncbi:hypothetical protein Drorol1_Dr00019061 [Drosera rotundifolia]
MQFFDFNIPYNDDENPSSSSSSGKTLAAAADKAKATKHKNNRLKLAVKAMELGYSGVAYNRTISGVMSDSDLCSISPFPMSSLLNLSPSLSSSATFRRLLLGVSADSTFRQYTRLTVAVDNLAQVCAINSKNPILKSYDLVAVRPLNETVFEQACQSSEVDLISIDFSDKLRFRLKLPAIKAALARGVFFEICYSPLLEDAHLRGYLIPNVKYLVSWTRGKNLIVSSCASSVLGLRGPADVSNLLFLLGLPLQHAKSAVSKNCRSMITSALKKKQFFKEAIRVEPMPSQCHPSSQEPWIIDWMKWDPISSGEGDLPLDDIAKSFSDVDKCTKTVRALKPTSISARKTSSSLQYMDFTSKIGDLSHKAGDLREEQQVALPQHKGDLREEQEVALPQHKAATLFHSTHLNSQPNELDVTKRTFPRDSSKAFLDVSDIGTSLTSSQKLECAGLVTDKSDVGVHSQLEDATSISLAGMLLEESLKNASTTGDKLDVRHTASTSADTPDMWEDLDPHNPHVGGSTGIEVNDGSNYSLISLDLAFQDVMEREGFRESDVQAHGMISVDDDLIILSSDAEDDDLVLLSPPTDSKIDDIGRMDSVTQGSMNIKVSSDTNSIGLSDSAEVSSQEDILEREHRPESEIKAAMQADRIIHTDTSVDRRFGCSKSLNSDFVKEVVKTRKRKRNHMKLKTGASSASVSCGDAEFDHGKKKRGVDDDRSVMQALLPEQNMLRGSIRMKCTKANRLSSCQTKPDKGKSRRRVPRQVLPSPSKHLFRVSFKKKGASAKARKS